MRGGYFVLRGLLRIGGGWGQKRRTPARINASRSPASWWEERGGRFSLLRLARHPCTGGRARRRNSPHCGRPTPLQDAIGRHPPGKRHDAPSCRGLRADRPPPICEKGATTSLSAGAPALLSEASDWLSGQGALRGSEWAPARYSGRVRGHSRLERRCTSLWAALGRQAMARCPPGEGVWNRHDQRER